MNTPEKFLHAINSVPGCEWRILSQLWDRFKDWKYVWEKAFIAEIMSAGTGGKFAVRLVDFRRRFDVDAEFAKLWSKDIAVVSRKHPGYPKALLQLPDAPFLLYYKGAALESSPAKGQQAVRMAIVGTRNPTKYGEKIAYDLAEALAQQNIVVVSGLAFGIDAIAHFSVVSIQKPTVAVLASGLYDITPSTHQRLAENILAHGGTLISEYPPSAPAYPVRFLQRNRIIAGLSKVTVVIEAGERSGALVTARLANEYNREVYAVPGDISRPQAQGCLQLLFKGAHPFISIESFLLDQHLSTQKILPTLSPEEQKLFQAFENKPCSPDELIEKTLFTISTVNILLTELEFKGLIHRNHKFLWEVCSDVSH